MKNKRILLTGGFGFIGSNCIKHLLETTNAEIINLDNLSEGSNRANLPLSSRITNLERDISLSSSFADLGEVDLILHFAAQSHVDRSLHDASRFFESNAIGTLNVMEYARRAKPQKVIAVSTDEVYGSIKEGSFTESSPISPNNPYSASKAAGEMAAFSYYKTFGVPVVVTRCGNNFGPNQAKEKLIPKVIECVKNGIPVPIYDEGLQVREWVYVLDHVKDILALSEHGKPGESYNIGGGYELTNIALVKEILAILGKPEHPLEFIPNARPGHDWRYSLSYEKVNVLLGGIREKTKEEFLNNLRNLIGKETL